MNVIDYSPSTPPSARRNAVAVGGFVLAAVSLTITCVYAARLWWAVRHGAAVTTFRLSLVLHAIPVIACALCLLGRGRRGKTIAGVAMAAASLAVMLIMGSRFWP